MIELKVYLYYLIYLVTFYKMTMFRKHSDAFKRTYYNIDVFIAIWLTIYNVLCGLLKNPETIQLRLVLQ